MRVVMQYGFWCSLGVVLGYTWIHEPVAGAMLTAIVCGLTLLVTL